MKKWLEKKKFVTFIADVINATSDVKTERIQMGSCSPSGHGRVEMRRNKR